MTEPLAAALAEAVDDGANGQQAGTSARELLPRVTNMRSDDHQGWSGEAIPDLSDRTVLITGASNGIGRATALAIAQRGAHVVLACRDEARADATAALIRALHPAAAVEKLIVDLASIDSIHRAADRFYETHRRLDILVNNAGVMVLTGPPRYTTDGFEQHLGVNHLGHFALTGRLLAALLRSPSARIVWVSSLSYQQGTLNLDDLHWRRRRYRPFRAYGDSKLATLMAVFELQRQLTAAGAPAIAVAAHPGGARTDLMLGGPAWMRLLAKPQFHWCTNWMTQDVAAAALPTLRAATDPAVRGGDFYGPDGWRGLTGNPVRIRPAEHALDGDVHRALWDRSQELTGVTFGTA